MVWQWVITNIIALPIGLSILGVVTFAAFVIIFEVPLQENDWPPYPLPLGYFLKILIT
ncbi:MULTISPECIES: hypothetical protein [Okeania]|uniref:hypothetical protein n=1 Tax=Okeania TaxID=1458928 RepID=UPI0013751FE6|nr:MULTISPECIES: hypothetical protein [Okeania]NEP06439.1 hypothetical protein [Okeania sp. SIO4D6]NEP39610.1 hypothetical protein [Okeania sp. SIO2H7]NET11654.1 hypothetical protein [Okeania sp. SIO1H6]NEP73279.1 hypothetical protein [Okeania sp. SIO2G5]NEP91697.1 hypothetical protein [Okeania sp. SIO2F5]